MRPSSCAAELGLRFENRGTQSGSDARELFRGEDRVREIQGVTRNATKFAVAEAATAEAQYRGVSRRRQYRGGNGTAEATVSRSIEWIVVNNVIAAGGRGGEYRGLHDPEISCSHASPGVWRAEPGDPDLIAG